MLKLTTSLKISELIDQLEKDGCSCDIMYGYQCKIHTTAREARALLGTVNSRYEDALAVVRDKLADPQFIRRENLSLLKELGKPYRCSCGCNVFVKFPENKYMCNACEQLFEGIPVDRKITAE